MLLMLEVALGLLALTPTVGASYAAAFAYRARRRNALGRCGHCGGPPYASSASASPAFVQGRLVCGPCAERSARRMHLALGATVVLGGSVVMGTTLGAVLSGGGAFWWFPVGALGQYSLMVGGAMAWMKHRNRVAQRELSAGAAHPTPRQVLPGS